MAYQGSLQAVEMNSEQRQEFIRELWGSHRIKTKNRIKSQKG